jgi:glycosyltransferase involved in cell wall biosynthesis
MRETPLRKSDMEKNSDWAHGAPRWPVMVLAHNEERHIKACLDSIVQSESGRRFDIFVMANGCTDGTQGIVQDYAKQFPEVKLVTIALGDKCNAWNVFIH